MKRTILMRPGVLAVVNALAVSVWLGPTAPRADASLAAPARARLQLIAAQSDLTLIRSHGFVTLDPGIWVAPVGGDLRLRVRRLSYTRPIAVAAVVRGASGRVRFRRLPRWVPDGWNGLAHFLRFAVTNPQGRVVASGSPTFCPNTTNPQRSSSSGGLTDPYPRSCSPLGNPFQLSSIWGIRRGWAADAFDALPAGGQYELKPGAYTLVATITSRYRRLFDIAAARATATVNIAVRNGKLAAPTLPSPPSPPPSWRHVNAPLLKAPPRAALPDLVALPAWQIILRRIGQRDELAFNAGVWNRGAPLDVQGFRSAGSPVMPAYQFFSVHGRVVGRLPAGTMGFDAGHGHDHWHFAQYARYLLERPDGSTVVTDPKVGFCLGPSDPIALTLPGAQFQPPFHESAHGCGTATNLWVEEKLPTGWNDTYTNAVEGQTLDVTNVPNGRYRIAVVANPVGVLRETTMRNDTSLRVVILGGRRGVRTLRVPAWHGIDPESSVEF